jgi:site-specific DNA-methyltransferase (adenine-specific)
MDLVEYEEWLNSWLKKLVRILKENASIYICSDWKSSSAIFRVGSKYFNVRNRITWEREKGRGAKANWKNCTEDIWFFTNSSDYTFNVNDVKLRRKVLAPYKDEKRKPKDWLEKKDGNFRDTFPSNIWNDISVPFWSMPENTEHPTQKPEKLLAKITLASTNKGDVIFDPFMGSGTTAVVAKKLGRKYVGVEVDEYYCHVAEKRLELAEKNKRIQGYEDGVFWERNTLLAQVKRQKLNVKRK